MSVSISWMADAVCAGVDPEVFFPTKGEASRIARSLCGGCPVATACLEYALLLEGAQWTNGLRYGVWGGTTPQQRARTRTKFCKRCHADIAGRSRYCAGCRAVVRREGKNRSYTERGAA